MAKELRKNIYTNDSEPNHGTFIDKSRLKFGQQSLSNGLHHLKLLDFD